MVCGFGGYPAGNKKRIAKVGNTPYYMKLDAQMTARDMITDNLTVNDLDYKRKKIKAHVVINATFFDDRGKQVLKTKGMSKSDEWLG